MSFDWSEALRSFGIEALTWWVICEMIAVFGTIGTIAVGLVTYGVRKLLRVWKSLSDAEAEANKVFEQMADRLKLSGTTLGGRTDIGFFVILQLDDLRAGVAQARFIAMCTVLLAIVFAVQGDSKDSDIFGSQLLWSTIRVGNSLLVLVCLAVGVGFFVVAERYARYIDNYVSMVKRIWNEALKANISKRAKRNPE